MGLRRRAAGGIEQRLQVIFEFGRGDVAGAGPAARQRDCRLYAPHHVRHLVARQRDLFQRRAFLDFRHGGQHEQREVGGLVARSLDREC